jgi:hypothetical protein
MNHALECNIIVFEVTELNGRPLEKLILYDLVYKFWIALGFSTDILLVKEALVCFLKV